MFCGKKPFKTSLLFIMKAMYFCVLCGVFGRNSREGTGQGKSASNSLNCFLLLSAPYLKQYALHTQLPQALPPNHNASLRPATVAF